MRFLTTFLFFVLLPFAVVARAPADLENLREVLERLAVDAAPADLDEAPIAGFLEVVRGTQVLYVSADGKLLIDGDVLSLRDESNLTERRRAEVRRRLLSRVPANERIVAAPDGETLGRVVVFVDTDCPYCAVLHRRRTELARRGVEIHYLFYPRSGPEGASFAQAAAAWCRDDRLAALDAVFADERLPAVGCAHPIQRHYELARQLDLKGTPAIVSAGGAVRYGALSVEEIVALARL